MTITRLKISAWAAVGLPLLMLTQAGCLRSPQEKSASYVAAGKQLMQKNDLPRAVLQFRNAIKASPGNAEAYYQLGLAFTAAQDYSSALSAFRRTVSIDPKHVGARLQIAQMMANTNNEGLLKAAQTDLQSLMTDSASPTSEMLNTLALTEMKLGDVESAARTLERALSEFSPDLASFVMLAQAKLRQNDPQAAEDVLKNACRALPKSADSHRILAEFYASRRRVADAEAELSTALGLDPKNGPALYEVARLKLNQGKQQDAEEMFRRLAAIDGYRPIYGVFLYQSGRRDDAVRELERVARANPNDRVVRSYLLSAYRLAGRNADVDRVLNEALKKDRKDSDTLLKRAELLIDRGQLDQAETDLNTVINLNPSSAEAHYLQSRLFRLRGSAQQYRQQLTETLRLNPALLSVRIELAQDFVRGGDGQSALDVLDAALPSQRSSTPLIAARNWALWTKGDLPAMRKGIDEGLSRIRNLDFLVQDALWKYRAGNTAAAQKVLTEALQTDPGNLFGLQLLSRTYTDQKNLAVALQKLKEYAARSPNSASVQNFLGQMLVASGDFAQARAVFTAVKAASPNAVATDFWLAQLDYMERKYDQARARLQTILASDSSNITAHLWLGVIELKRGDHNTAIDHFRKVLAAQPDHALAANNLAYALAEHTTSYDEALKYAQKAVELAPKEPSFTDTLGWIFYRKGLYSSAVRYLELATSDPQDALPRYHLAMAYAKAGDPRSVATLHAALKINPSLPEAKAAREVVGTPR